MNNKSDIKVVKRIMLLFAILSSFLTFDINSASFALFFIVPLIYGIGYYLFIPNKVLVGPGFVVLNLILFIRYIIYPPVFKFDGYFFIQNLSETNIQTGLVLFFIEMLIIIMLSRFWLKKKDVKVSLVRMKISYVMPIVFLFLYIFIVKFHPHVFSNRHFILNPSSLLNEKVSLDSAVFAKIAEWAEFFLTLLIACFLYKKQKKILLISFLLISSLYYEGSSRLSLLKPLLVSMFVLFRVFPNLKKKLSMIFLGIAFSSMLTLSIVKVYKTTDITSIKLENTSSMLNAYFGGVINIAVGVKAFESNDFDKVQLAVNDMFRNSMGFSKYFQSDYNSVQKFNNTFYGVPVSWADQIPPTVTQGLFYFGYLFFGLLTIIMVSLVFIADRLYFKANQIDFLWITTYFAISLGWAVPGSFQHLYMQLHYVLIPLSVLIIINRKLNFKV